MEYMSPSLARWLAALAATKPNEEICGLIFEDWTFVQINNVAIEPAHNFHMDYKQQLEEIRKANTFPMGVFHSHPGGGTEPTPTDLLGWPPVNVGGPYCRYWIITPNKVIEWNRDSRDDISPVWEHSWGPKTDMAESVPQRPEGSGS